MLLPFRKMAIATIALFSLSIPSDRAIATSIGDLLPDWSPEKAVTTNIKDARAISAWLDDFPETVPDPADASLAFAPGYYRFTVQSYCLHAGTYAPTQGDGYLLATLEGNRAELIRAILQRSLAQAQISQQDIQRLIWGIEAGANFTQYPLDFQVRIAPLLEPSEIAALSIDVESIAGRLIGRFIPDSLKRALNLYRDIRQTLTNAQATYEDLERIAILTGVAPTGKGSRTIDPGNWNYAGDGFYLRTYPQSYPTTTVELLRPAAYRLQRDARGRIIVFESGNYRIETTYEDTPGGDRLVSPEGESVPIWRFRRLHFSGPQPGDEWTVENTGWIVASSEGMDYGDRPGAKLAAIAVKTTSGDRARPQILASGGNGEPTWKTYRDRVNSAREKWEKLDRYRQELERANRPPSEDAIRDLTDLTHYRDGLEAAKNPADLEGKGEWFRDHLGRVTNGWNYVNCVLAGECDPPGDEFDRDRGDRPKPFDPSGKVAVPGNTVKQRLGLSGRLQSLPR
ncbi:MAG: hypothetical protein D6680_06115 [Cyanobacteria bacterium J007]|nr:MAG: hypothetical protein D6680_06115 [Cyanobacteria bacterium J007]